MNDFIVHTTERRDCGVDESSKYVELLEFTLPTRFWSFENNLKYGKIKTLVEGVKVVIAVNIV